MTRLNSRGYTMVEAVAVIVLIALLGAIGLPKMRQAHMTTQLNGGRSALRLLAMSARTAAITRAAPSVLRLQPDSQWVEVQVGGVWQRVGHKRQIAQEFKVVLWGADSVRFLPTGQAVIPGGGLSLTLYATHGSYSKSVLIESYGRIQ
jgi:Tfp pilus assembly protein FimT